ncbi:MAG: pyrroline-5-carboxylate reductase [Saprospiraceae bacterium]|nr:pyrroline-5-carboxylate reductase [Saprospiraceae bacterium]
MKILVIGGGNMGKTYAQSFLRSHIVQTEEMMILEKSAPRAAELQKENIGNICSSPEECLPIADLVILAVKPQDIDDLFIRLKDLVDPQQVFISIMAGIKISTIKQGLGIEKVIRAMPNLPAQIGMGMTAFTSTDEVTRIELTMVQNLLNTTGKSIYVDKEELLDAATAISGSGPAYVFYCMQAFISAAKSMGFSDPEAELLTWQTFKGAVELFHKNDLTCEEWISRVASSGGTTEAALDFFSKENVGHRLQGGAHAARDRAIALGTEKSS